MKCEPRPRDFAPGLCPDQSVQQLQMIRILLEMSTQASKFFVSGNGLFQKEDDKHCGDPFTSFNCRFETSL